MLAPYVSAKTVAVGGCLALLSGVLVATASADQAPLPGRLVAASELGRAPLPAGDADRSVAGLERSALRLAAALDAVPVREGGPEEDRYCPAGSLRVQWAAPAPTYAVGAHLDPVGPAPDDRTAAVNGIVVCEGVGYAYMGFEAHWSGAAWVVTAVPSLSDEHGEHEEEHAEQAHADEAHADEAHEDEAHEDQAHAEEHGHAEPTVAPPAAAPAPAPPAGLPGLGTSAAGAVDPYARYDPQRTCDPVAKPGTSALSAMLLRTYPASRSLGLSRTCTARGVSEHKEGRAFDWGVNVGVAAQRAAAESALSQLLATDAAGNRHALARRLGVMYLIWDRKIWSAYNPTAGWRPYSGASPHTDHVHISLSWDGAMGRTSYWQGANASLLQLDPALQLAYDHGSGGSGSGGSGGSGGSLPVAPVAHAPAPAGTAPQRRGGRDRKGHDGVSVAPAPEQGAPTAGVVEPLPGAHRDEREQRRKASKEGKRREREAQEMAAAAAAEAEAAAAAQAQAAAVAAAAAAERAAAPPAQPAAAAPAAGRGAGKVKGKDKAAAAPAPAEPARASGKGGGSKAEAPKAPKAPKAPEVAKGGKGSAKGVGKGAGKDKAAKAAKAPKAPAATGKGGGGGKGGGKKGG